MPAIRNPQWHQRWLALDEERTRCLDFWSSVLRELEKRPGWFGLTASEQDLAEQLSGLHEIDGHLRVIDRRLRRWLRALPKTPAMDIGGVVANLQVAERLLPPEESPIVHGVIVRAIRDLGHMELPE